MIVSKKFYFYKGRVRLPIMPTKLGLSLTYDYLDERAGITGASDLGSASGSSSGPGPNQPQQQLSSSETIEATPEHPIWVIGKGWTNAGELKAGGRLVAKDGQELAVIALQLVKKSAQVYNFEVDQLHTYFVGGKEQ